MVIKDPSNPENEGQVKIINAGIQLNKIIQNAIDGDDKDEFGFRIFDLSPNGCNLRIKVETNDGGYPTYVSSRFVSPSPVEGLDDADEIYNQVKSLDTIFQQKSYEEIKNLLDSHFFGKEVSSTPTQTVDAEEDDDKTFKDLKCLTFEDVNPVVEKPTPVLSEQEKKVQDILKDL